MNARCFPVGYALILFAVFAVADVHDLHAQGTPRIVTHTRFQVLFGDMETQILTALQQNDIAALKSLMSDDFQVWRPERRDPLPLEDWQAQNLKRPPKSFHIENIAVRAIAPDLAIANFLLTVEVGSQTGKPAEQYFIADVWQRTSKAASAPGNTQSPAALSTETWMLVDRYQTRLTPTPAAKPKVHAGKGATEAGTGTAVSKAKKPAADTQPTGRD